MITLCCILFGDANFNIEKLKLNFNEKFKYLISYNQRDENEYLKFVKSDFIKKNKNIHVYLGNKVSWGDISIVDSMVNIINKAKEIFNTKYVFIIDSKTVLIRSYDYILNKLESDENCNFFDFNKNWKTIYQNKKDTYYHRPRIITTLFYLFRDYNFKTPMGGGWKEGLIRINEILSIAKKNKKEYLKRLWREKKYFEYFSIQKKYWKSFIRIFSINFISSYSNFWTTEYHGADPKIFFGKETLTKNDEDILTKCFLNFGFNFSGSLNYLYNLVNSDIFKKNYEKFKNIIGPEEWIFSLSYTEYNKNWKNEKSYTCTLRNSKAYFKKKKENELNKTLFNKLDPNYGYYFFYRKIFNEKELENIKKFINKNENTLN